MNKYIYSYIAVLLFGTFLSSFAMQKEYFSFAQPRTKPKPKPNSTARMELLSDKLQRTLDKTYFLQLDLRTNLLYDLMISPTIGFEWHKNRYWGIKVDGSFTHWGSKHGMVHNFWLLNPEFRRYINNTDLFYIGMGGNVGGFNIYRGVVGGLFFPEHTGYQGSFFGVSISAGYKLIWSKYITFDFNLGFGVTHFKYDSFTVIDKQRVYQRVKMKDVTKTLWGPTQAGVSLVWKISGYKKMR